MTTKFRMVTDNNEFTFVEDFNYEYESYHSQECRLRTCSATIGYTENYYYLRSYNTIVAFIDRRTGEAFDILRTAYGYTSTSAQHISKFLNEYRHFWSRVFRTNIDKDGLYYQRIR